MGKIRSFIDFQFTDVDGNTVRNGAFASRWFNGVNLYIDDQYISARKMNRRICSCGNVDDEPSDVACPVCGNTSFVHLRLSSGRYYRANDQKVYEKITHLTDDGVYAYDIDVKYDSSKGFVLQEEKYSILRVDNGFYYSNAFHVDQQDAICNFLQYVNTRPEWTPALNMLVAYPTELIAKLDKHRDNDVMTVCINYYNMQRSIPGIETVSPDLFMSIYQKFICMSNSMYNSLQDFYKSAKAPLALSDIYGVVGLPNSDLSNLDKLDNRIVRAVSYALVHRHTAYSEVEPIFRTQDDVDQMNEYAVEFAEFFRKNIVKFSSRTWEAFKYINSEYNATSIKDANIKKFARYASKKGIKNDKITQFADLMYAGNAIEALEALL